jgi:hut operon positive regulator
MSRLTKNPIGKSALLLVLSDDNVQENGYLPEHKSWTFCQGRVGSMESNKIVAAVETATKRSGLIQEDVYRESHALYHAIIEALEGITRGNIQLGDVLRTVGLRFSVVRGNPYENKDEGDWIAVALYGTIGAPVKGSEHEAVGLGINHI